MVQNINYNEIINYFKTIRSFLGKIENLTILIDFWKR